jgi:twitching motility protein PilT
METLTLDESQREAIGSVLARCPLFRALKSEHIPQVLQCAEVVRFEPEEVVLRQGDASNSFLVLLEGEAAVRVQSGGREPVEIGRVPKPASIGEIGLLLDQPRTATVVAAGELTALRFSARVFHQMFQQVPNFGVGLAAGLAYRLEQVSGRVPLPEFDLAQQPPAAEALTLLPFELCQRHRVLALRIDGQVLTLGHVDDPTSQVILAVREHVPGLDVQSVHVELAAFNQLMRARAGALGWIREGRVDEPATLAPLRVRCSPRLDALLRRVAAEGASDLHLSAGQRPRWRVDGEMQEIADAPALGEEEAAELLAPVMDERHREQFAAENDVDFAYAVPGVARFRVNLFRDHNGSGAVLRLIPAKAPTLEQLGLPQALRELCEQSKGLVLVSGPAGSGKSTTLAALVDFVKDTRRVHVVTIEDPIEFVHESALGLVNQREVGGHTRSFSRALQAALREDPDVILVGELRDTETVALALEAARTGHLVLAALRASGAPGAIERLLEAFPAGQQAQARASLSEVLRGVVAQALCRKLDGGRMAVLEVLIVTAAAANLIREGRTAQLAGLMQASRALGMSLLNDELARLVDQKKVALEEALGRTADVDDLLRRLRSGLTLAADPAGDRFRVMAVKASSPGAQAGLQRGDTIVEVDGRPAKGMALDEARALLRGEGVHALAVERAGRRLRLSLDLRRG